jgi:DNA invertase Pin-like site-specific DNA recombinase
MQVIGYVRVSTDEQRMSGAGLDAQRAAIMRECNRRGWKLLQVSGDAGLSGKDLKRPGVQAALEILARGDADALVVAKLDRLSRSMLDFAAIMTRAQKQNWALVALDMNVDTTTPAGEAMAHVMATFAQFERRLIGQRTKEALAAKRRQGVRLGRPPAISPDLAERIRAERASGASLRAIAATLTLEGVPTPRGGREWRPSSLERVLRSQDGGTR